MNTTDNKDNLYDKTELFDKEIHPFLAQAHDLCEANDIPLLAIACPKNTETSFVLGVAICINGAKTPKVMHVIHKMIRDQVFLDKMLQAADVFLMLEGSSEKEQAEAEAN